MVEDVLEDDGFARAQANVRNGRSRFLVVADVDRRGWLEPDDLIRRTFAITYQDARGVETTRWITVNNVNGDPPESLWAYCWGKKSNRKFLLPRIVDIFDSDGQVLDGDDFRAALDGERRRATPSPRPSPETLGDGDTSGRRRLTRSERRVRDRQEAADRAREDAAAARRAGGRNPPSPSPAPSPDPAPRPSRKLWGWWIAVILTTAGAVYGFVDEGRSAGFGMIFFAVSVAFIVGLFRPAAVLPYARTPTRLKVTAFYFGIVFGMLGIDAVLSPVIDAPAVEQPSGDE